MSARRPMTLKRLREAAPPQDRNDRALRPTPREPKSRWKTNYWAETLEELSAKCGQYGPAAAAHAKWDAIRRWATGCMGRDRLPPLANPRDVVSVAIDFASAADAGRLGYPNWDGEPVKPGALYALSPESQREAMRVAAETEAQWEAAGRPHLTAKNLQYIQQYIYGCIRTGAANASTDHIFNPKDEN